MERIFEILWSDLTPDKQNEIFKALGDNGNYDVFPLATIIIGEEETNHAD